ncbi:ABC transporter substrate-binding protein [Microcoleus sp. FACHB-672]|uniref:ABC transporter substrate-binding protein n=1 Tax=Microcoleus sp. FACHB-672 TaxID=2692825 RepID=UPI001685EFB5|nr:ABC transporter substrate-binding protein [Microcoleus sp. FACHB-672]MBD2039446.1 ABC transporter substrate-binding protein [Microcoleus sp. FACHB-672]
MGKQIIFTIGNGSFDQGFPVEFQIREAGQTAFTITGQLPPAAEILQRYDHWQQAYCSLEKVRHKLRRIKIPSNQTKNVSNSKDCSKLAEDLETTLKQWFDCLPLQQFSEPAQIILQTQDPALRRLPWHLWNLVEHRPDIELCVNFQNLPNTQPVWKRLPNPVRILAVLGSDEGIDTQADLQVLQQLPAAKVTQLQMPHRSQLIETLLKQHWDILFFAGHSFSNTEGKGGQIYLNETECLSLNDLRLALHAAVQKGLMLAIFNSCDGLGLAQNAADLQIPHVIVMREPVSDPVAHAFLRYFFEAFAQGQSLYRSVWQARAKLQGMEDKFPGASWLPVLCPNPTKPLPVWCKPRSPYRQLTLLIGILTIPLALFAGWKVYEWNALQRRISLGEKILIKSVKTPEKEAGVKAFAAKNFPKAISHFQTSLKIHQNDPETRIYLNNAKAGLHPAITIGAAVPIGTNSNVAQEILRGMAQVQEAVNRAGGINGKFLKVQIADDNNNPNLAKRLAEVFVEDSNILAVIGHNASDASAAGGAVYQGKLVMITPTSFSKGLVELGGRANDNFLFRTVPSLSSAANKLARYAIKTAQKTRIAMCFDIDSVDNQSFRYEFAAVMDSAIREDGGTLIDIRCNFGAPGFNAEVAISRAKNHGADAMLLSPHVDRLSNALDIAKANRGQLALFSSPTLHTAKTLEGQADVNNLVIPVFSHPAAMSANHPFIAGAKNLWGSLETLTWRTPSAYDATQAVVAAVKQSDGSRQQLQRVLSSPGFSVPGAFDEVQFHQWGDRVGGNPVLVQVQPNRSAGKYEFKLIEGVEQSVSLKKTKLIP